MFVCEREIEKLSNPSFKHEVNKLKDGNLMIKESHAIVGMKQKKKAKNHTIEKKNNEIETDKTRKKGINRPQRLAG